MLNRRAARKSLLSFTEYTKPDFEVGDHHQIIADALDRFELAVERKESPRLLIEAPPRHTKSELGSRRFPAKCLGNHPDWQFITATYAQDLASDFGRDVREIVSGQEYQNLFPGTQLRADSQAANRWHVRGGGVYVAVGVGGPITGRGAHVAVIDDPFKNRQDADSETIRENVWRWYTSTLYTRLMPGGGIVMVLTRWHEDDLAARAIAADPEAWEVVKLPALTDGKALWPEWYDCDALQDIRKNIGEREFGALYQQEPTPDEGLYFAREDFRRFTLGSQPEHLHRYISSDFAVTAKAEADWTVFGDWGIDSKGEWWLLNRYKEQTTADQWVAVLAQWFKSVRPFLFFGETGVIRRAIEPLLEREMREQEAFTTLEWFTRTTDKQAAAQAFRGMCKQGKIHIPLTDWGEDLINELIKFPAGAHDDQVDMCALIGLAVNKGVVAQVPEEIEAEFVPDDYGVDEYETSEHKLL